MNLSKQADTLNVGMSQKRGPGDIILIIKRGLPVADILLHWRSLTSQFMWFENTGGVGPFLLGSPSI